MDPFSRTKQFRLASRVSRFISEFHAHRFLLNEGTLSVNLRGDTRTAAELLLTLDNNDQLPGWSRADHGTVSLGSYSKFGGALLGVLVNTPLKSVTINFQKRGDSTVYRYTISRWSARSDWLLQRAWQVDSHGKMIKEFPMAFPAFPLSNSPKT